MKKWLSLLLSMGLTATWASAPAEDLQGRLNAMKAMQANFKQVVKTKKKIIAQSSGTMALQRPGRFRWETKSPMAQLIVADGKKMWIYDVDLEQVTVKKQDKGIGGTAALFLSGYDDTVSRNFDVTNTSEGKSQHFYLKSKSKKDSFQQVEMVFDGNNLQSLKLFDQLGQVTDVKLSAIKNNVELNSQLFSFKPPKGVDVVQQ
jgi:outer membrane lipoprotein carrier protein